MLKLKVDRKTIVETANGIKSEIVIIDPKSSLTITISGATEENISIPRLEDFNAGDACELQLVFLDPQGFEQARLETLEE